MGIISNLGFGIMLIAGQFVWPAQPLWQYVRPLTVHSFDVWALFQPFTLDVPI